MVDSREAAQVAVTQGRVTVRGAPADKSSRLVAPDDALVISTAYSRFVSRGGDKLDAALDRFGVDVSGKRCLDAGASTGGFTDCLVQRGAASVLAVDVGRGQLHRRLLTHPRVVSLERTNIRHLTVTAAGGPFSVVVADLSFISLRTVIPVLFGDLAVRGAVVVLLVKPQFEVGRLEASKGRGVIRAPELWHRAVTGVASAAAGAGAAIMGAMVSPLKGADGNVEFFLHTTAHGDPAPDPTADIDAVVAEASR